MSESTGVAVRPGEWEPHVSSLKLTEEERGNVRAG